MRGSSHIMMSLVIFLPTFIFLHKYDPSVSLFNHLGVVAIGIMFGSLLPDLDAKDSKIMYGWWRPFGLISKYAFYKPLRRLLGKRTEHREILHSLIGCLITSLFFALISLVLYLVGFFIIMYIWIGILVGFLLHLAEDSFTYFGVRWFFPRGEPIRSTTITGSGGEYFLLFISFIVFGSWTTITFYLLPASLITVYLTIGITIVLLVILHRLNPRINEIGNRRYSLEELVEFYIEDVGGKRIKNGEPSGPVLQIESDEEYIVPILGMSSKWGLDRDFRNKYSRIEASSLKEDDVIEMRTYDGEKEKRVYYIVTDGIFYAYLKRYL